MLGKLFISSTQNLTVSISVPKKLRLKDYKEGKVKSRLPAFSFEVQWAELVRTGKSLIFWTCKVSTYKSRYDSAHSTLVTCEHLLSIAPLCSRTHTDRRDSGCKALAPTFASPKTLPPNKPSHCLKDLSLINPTPRNHLHNRSTRAEPEPHLFPSGLSQRLSSFRRAVVLRQIHLTHLYTENKMT
jgi:hypothetical protein